MKLLLGSFFAAANVLCVSAFGGKVESQKPAPAPMPAGNGSNNVLVADTSINGDKRDTTNMSNFVGVIKDNISRDQAMGLIDAVSGNLADDSITKAAIDDAISVLGACEKCACENEAPPLIGQGDQNTCCGGFLSDSWNTYCDGLTFNGCFETCIAGAQEIRTTYSGDKDAIVGELTQSVIGILGSNPQAGNALGNLGAGLGGFFGGGNIPGRRQYNVQPAQPGEYCGYLFSAPFKPCEGGSDCMLLGYSDPAQVKGYGICLPSDQDIQSTPTFNSSAASVSAATKQYGDAIINKGIKLVAFDFDKTACNEHTYKQSYFNYEQIAEAMSQDFIDLALYLDSKGIDLAIVTYNTPKNMFVRDKMTGGEEMVRAVLRLVWPNNQDLANSIPVYDYQPPNSQVVGKNPHLQDAQQYYFMLDGVQIPNSETVLVDDTTTNITAAKNAGYWTIPVVPAHGFTYQNKLTAPASNSYNNYYYSG